MGRWLFLPDTVQKDLEILARASADRISSLRALLDSNELIRPFAVYLRVGEILGVSDQEAASLYSFWEYVQQERTENDKTGEDTVDEFLHFLTLKNASSAPSVDKPGVAEAMDGVTRKRSALRELFDECPNRDFARKTSLLESGPLPHLANIRTFCDVRPIYNRDGTAIIDHVELITLRLGIHSAHVDENKEVLINLRENDLDRIGQELERARRKLALLKNNFQLKIPKAKKTSGG